MEDGAVAHLLDAVDDARGGGLFLYLLAHEAPEEILGGLVALCGCHVYQFVNPARNLALVLLHMLEHTQGSGPLGGNGVNLAEGGHTAALDDIVGHHVGVLQFFL